MENNLSLGKRLWIYQKERFPLFGHGPLIAAFSFSAISYSRISAGKTDFIPLMDYLSAFFIAFTLFLLLRIFDEFKDNADDLKFRKYLPVPRGLVSLKELKYLGMIVVLLQLSLLIAFYPILLPYYFLLMGYLVLMSKEFFVPEWLKKKPILYMGSHMFIIPFVDIMASSFDWKIESTSAPVGLLFFFLVSYFNGIVIEIGRKIKTPEMEEEGVTSYSGEWGMRNAVFVWIGILTTTLMLAITAGAFADYEITTSWILLLIYLVCLVPAILFLKNPSKKHSKWIEVFAGVWTLLMYLTLGAGPMISNFINA